MNYNIGKKLKEERKKMALTQKEFADNFGFPRSAISEIESGRRKAGLKTIERLAKATNTELSFWLNNLVDEKCNSTNNLLSCRIKMSRKELNMSQQEFAKALGISRSYLGDIETGRKEGININLIKKISEVTRKPINYFIYEDEIADKYLLNENFKNNRVDTLIQILIDIGEVKDGKMSDRGMEMLEKLLTFEVKKKIKEKEKEKHE